jgi:hypothetical protein
MALKDRNLRTISGDIGCSSVEIFGSISSIKQLVWLVSSFGDYFKL